MLHSLLYSLGGGGVLYFHSKICFSNLNVIHANWIKKQWQSIKEQKWK